MGFLIRLESVASPETPEEAINRLCDLVVALELPPMVGVIADVNGADAYAYPTMTRPEVVRLWRRAMEDKRR